MLYKDLRVGTIVGFNNSSTIDIIIKKEQNKIWWFRITKDELKWFFTLQEKMVPAEFILVNGDD